ncbi:aldehyde dehydrogenase family protein [Embleya hyalina]|uniref:Bifunctional aldehyde dehydrogenase/enoyl-CoA hydratase n=1 Tax=Embleya hyalina TaxID=516124 RepID=A0A401YM76_9ACTN|nr:aldehyde dehydrogenase family protein [Embleya hyalina]GCD95723.1 bifunctional aldehyde dehydrogenase/enoyl-CoA hydratase [Embleya hyalina]
MSGPVPHYLCGRRQPPADRGIARRHAVHGHEVFRVTTTGIDAAPAFAYARTVGIPALRGTDFAERARSLHRLARLLAGRREEFVRLLAHLGTSSADAVRDIDGGLEAMRRRAAAITRRLADGGATADGRLLVDDGPGARGSASRSVLDAPPGVAVRIGGFSLPATGLLGAFADTFVAGVPVVVRPSHRTAQVVAHLVRGIVESGEIPDGALQFVSGPTRLADHLTAHDLLGFTGTSATARRVRGRLATLRAAPREDFATDALDCAVLGVDGVPGTAAFAVFVDRLVAAITAYTGQTRAAVRRAFVPAPLVDVVAEAVAAALDEVRPGDPDTPGAGMGPLIDASHRRRVLVGVARLRGATRTIRGTPGRIAAVADEGRFGAYLPPVLLVADDPGRREVHEVEAFGPVGTLLPYRSSADIRDVLTLGGRDLHGWVVTEDPATARDLVRALTPTHSRVEIVDPHAPSAEPSAPYDPDDLGAFLRRPSGTHVLASPGHLAAVTDRWEPGAPRVYGPTHPLRRRLGEVRAGDAVTVGPRTVTRDDIDRFAELTGDRYYLHTDEAGAAGHPLFRGIVAHGYLVLSLAAGMFVPPEPGPVLANRALENLRFLAPVRPGDALTVTLTARRITPRPGARHGEVRWHVEIVNQNARPVADFDLVTLTADRPTDAGDKDTTHARHHHSRPL